MGADTSTITEQILHEHTEGTPDRGEPIDIEIDQTLLHDVLGPLIWLEFEALEYDEVRTDVAVQYADHQAYQLDARDTDTHRFLRTISRKYGGHFSKAGAGICHQIQRERFIEPGSTLLGGDSHSPTMGGFGALGIGAGGLDVALAMGGEPYTIEMPEIVEVRLTGELGEWTSAKDVILELLRRLSVKGGVGRIFEFTGPGVESLSVPERCTITNMTTELGSTTAVFPSDDRTRRHLERLGRGEAYRSIEPGEEAVYDDAIEVDLSEIEPLIATPSMPDNVVPVSEVAGTPVDQVIVGSCTNGSYADIAAVADVVAGEHVAGETDFILNPASKLAVRLLAEEGGTTELYAAGVNLSESTCGACTGQGHVPGPDSVSLRAFNRNFKGRSGQEDDSVYLCSPEVAAASAIEGEIVDPRATDLAPPTVELPDDMTSSDAEILPPDPSVEIYRGETIGTIPIKDPLGSALSAPITLVTGDDITTDHIMPASSEILSLWSNPQAAADYVLTRIDAEFPTRSREAGGGWIVAGENYGQGSSRENAALELVELGTDGVIAKSFARIHRSNLINFGVLPLRFADPETYERLSEGDDLAVVEDVAEAIRSGADRLTVSVNGEWRFEVELVCSEEERAVLAAGGRLPYTKRN